MRTVAIMEIISGVGVLGFWVAFYTVGLAPDKPPACYLNHENSFPYADAVMSLLFIFGGLMLLRGKAQGYIASIAAGGAFVFLGILDTTYNMQNGMYHTGIADAILNAFINIYAILFGAFVVWRCGQRLAVRA